MSVRETTDGAYRPEIDGLRAIAVVSVILFHAGFTALSGGFVGVDIFFVISGYLITQILLQELRGGNFSLIRFYERRIRRILPVLYFVLLVSSFAAWLWLMPSDYKRYGKSLLAVIFFVPNILFWSEGDYFDVQSAHKPLLHTWSLAVEEQYYLLFPLLLFSVWRFRRQHLIQYIFMLTLAGFALAEVSSHFKPTAAFFLAPPRAWELLAGGCAACCHIDKSRFGFLQKYRDGLSVAGLLLIVYAIFFFDEATRFPGAWALVPVVGTVLVILFSDRFTLAGKLLSNRIFVGLGLVSYSAYLWHQPVLVFFRQRFLVEPGKAQGVVLVGLIFCVSYLSWRFIESPFRKRNLIGSRRVFLTMGVMSVVLIVIGLLSVTDGGKHSRLYSEIDVSAERNKLPLMSDGWCFYSVDSDAELPVGDGGHHCFLGNVHAKKRALLFGDSFAGQYEPFWDELGKRVDLNVHVLTTNWCYPAGTDEFTGPQKSPAYAQCRFNRDFLLKHMGSYDVLILAGYWRQIYLQGKMSGVLDLIRASSGVAPLLVLMGSPVIFDENVNVRQQLSQVYGMSYEIAGAGRLADVEAVAADAMLAQAAQSASNIIFFSRDSLFGQGQNSLAIDGVPYSWDGYHISTLGSKRAAEVFFASHQFEVFQHMLHGH